jgi:putative hemolysin
LFFPLFGPNLPAPIEGALERLLVLDRFNEFLDRVHNSTDPRPFLERSLATLNIRFEISPQDLALVPQEGPVVVVANHPFGLVEGAILPILLRSVRPDVKTMANFWLSAFPVADQCIFVDPFGGGKAVRANRKGLKESIAWLERGGMLAVFPAGEVAHLNLMERAVIDPAWSQTVARIIRITGASVLPVYFRGANSALFQALGFVHPKVSTALLVHEFLNKSNRKIEVRIGKPLSPEKLRTYQDDVALTRYLRHRTYLLGDREAPAAKPARISLEPIAAPALSELIAAEVSQLAPDRTLVDAGEFSVLLARAAEIPNGIAEIGRLREATFREVGEGTGKPVDLDTFDQYYWHLFVWNKTRLEIVGAYRLGPSVEILERGGIQGFYSSSLFQWNHAFLRRIEPAVELGRSFVRAEYQKNFAPLMLLWKGIGQFLVRNPQYKTLFGPVSISNDYTAASRQLMVMFLNAFCRSRALAPFVRPRHPYRRRPSKLASELVGTAVRDIEDLSALIADVETDRKGVPILLKQYLKLGGEIVTFNVDPKFANALDGLIVVDLRKTETRVLERYMGKEGAGAFRRHGAKAAPVESVFRR